MRCDIDSWNSTAYQFCHNDSSPPWMVALDDPHGRKAQAAIFVASAFMFVLGGLLFGLGLFGRLSGRATLNFSVRIFLYGSFSLFVPLMSYLFSQAKEQAEMHGEQGLPFHAHVVLIWMLVVELLRKKVDTIIAAMSSSPLRGVHQESLWDAIDQIVRIAWTGYLIYSYVHGFRKPGFMILWVLTLIKTAQRVAAVEFAKRSFAIGKNAHLVMGYTAQMVEGEENSNEQNEERSVLSKCWYAVMGEEKLKREAGPDGYRVELPPESSDKKDLISVGDIWKLAEGGGAKAADILLPDHPELKDLCLSFALFKLLRGRLENLQVDEVHEDVIRKNRELIFRGLDESGSDSNNSDRDGDISKDIAERAFHVIELEINFVSDYYNSVVPVMMSSPWFFVGNYIFVLLIMVNQAGMVLFITGNARVLSIIGCLAGDVVKLSRRAFDLFKCLNHKLLKTIIMMFSSFNIIISLLLVLTFLLMEAWELFVYVLSDWFLVSLLCEYARRPKWQSSRCTRRAFCALLSVKRLGRRRSRIRFNQVCVLDSQTQRHTPWLVISKVLQHRFLGMPSVPVPMEVKHAIFACIKSKNGELLSNGAAVLHRHDYPQLLHACKSKSITEVILVWHIATCLFEMKNPAALSRAEETVATTLSKYCAYLVACVPELLPEDKEGSERVYKAVKRDLRSAMSKAWRRMRKSESTRVMRIGSNGTVANMGYELCRQVVEECGLDAAQGWALLAEIWTELIVYITPSDSIEGHAEALAKGGEFVTVLWALATHTGITRPSRSR